MTDRIAELKAQCISREVRGTNAFDSYMIDKFDSEKFAELIIRECAKLVRKHNYQSIQNEEPLYGITSSEILEHFGVEE